MFDALSLTDYLALMFGLYLSAAGIGLLNEGEGYKQAIADYRDNVAMGYLGAIIAFVIGAVMVKVHNDFDGWRAGLISLIGWGALLEGILMLAFRRQFMNFFLNLNFFQTPVIRGFGIGCLLVGLLLVGSVVL